jgi:Protein of unknown function (DUF3592)
MGEDPTRMDANSAPQKTTARGVVALLGLFAGLCAIFALGATLVDWRDARARAQWPVTTARIDHGSVEAVHDSRDDRGLTSWRLVYRLRYEVAGQTLAATLTGPATQSTEEAARMEAWVTKQRRGREISIRYDPAKPQDIAFASGDIPGARSRVTTDLQLLAIAVIACAVLLPLGRFLRAREARAAGAGGP